MGDEFEIREAVFDDAPTIAQVNLLTWLHAYRGIIPEVELDVLNLESVTEKWVEILSQASLKDCTIVATKDESIIAYSRIYPSVDGDDDPNRVATIGSMYVHPEFQRKGVGRALMSAVVEAAKNHGFTEATLHVLAANVRAREFYEGLGLELDLDADIDGSSEETVPKVRYRKVPL